MAYQIRYGTSKYEQSHQQKKVWNRKYWFAATILLFALWQLCGQAPGKWLLPGDPEVTTAALTQLQKDLRSGESIHAALTAFCEEIIDGAAMEE